MARENPVPKIPFSTKAELAVLGSMILNPDSAIVAFSKLREEDFYDRRHKVVFRSIQLLTSSGKPVDLVTLHDCLEKSKLLESSGDFAYIACLIDGMPDAMNITSYCDIIKEKSRQRSALRTSAEIEKMVQDAVPASEIVEKSVQSLIGIIGADPGDSVIRSWGDINETVVAEIEEERTNPNKQTRLFCGLKELDEMTSGLRRGEVVLIDGPSSHGKTLLALQYATTAERAGYSGVIFSAEMSNEDLVKRDLAYEADVPYWYLRRPEDLDEVQMAKLRGAKMSGKKLFSIDSGITPGRVFALSEAHKRSRGLDFVIVDYDQLVVEAGLTPEQEKNVFAFQRSFILGAKILAQRLDICFIIIAQLRKMPAGVKQGQRPTLDDIWGDSSMRNTPHLILFIIREFFRKDMNVKYENDVKIYVVKQRNGPTGVVEAWLDTNFLRLLDREPDEKESTLVSEEAF